MATHDRPMVLALTNPDCKIEDDAVAVQLSDNKMTVTVAIVDPRNHLGGSYDDTFRNAAKVQRQVFFAEEKTPCQFGDRCTKRVRCFNDGHCGRLRCRFYHPVQYPAVPPCTFLHADDQQQLRGTSNRLLLRTEENKGFNKDSAVPCVTLTATVPLIPSAAPLTKIDAENGSTPPALRIRPDAVFTCTRVTSENLRLDERVFEDHWDETGPLAEVLELLLQFACHLANLDRKFFDSTLPVWEQCAQVIFDEDKQMFEPDARKVWSKHRFVTETLVDWFSQRMTDLAKGPFFGIKYGIPRAVADEFGITPQTPSYAVCTSQANAELKLPLRFLLNQVPASNVRECFGDTLDDSTPFGGRFVPYTRYSFTHPLRDFACMYNIEAASFPKTEDNEEIAGERVVAILRRRAQIRDALNMLCHHATDHALWGAVNLPPPKGVFHHQLALIDRPPNLPSVVDIGKVFLGFRPPQVSDRVARTQPAPAFRPQPSGGNDDGDDGDHGDNRF